ncbi:MAG: hypothetical protein ACLR0B_14005 [Anaerobutyricum soehngenii]
MMLNYITQIWLKICEADDDLMMAYLDGEEPSVEELKRVLKEHVLYNGSCLLWYSLQTKAYRNF